jgi:hypothetical protein
MQQESFCTPNTLEKNPKTTQLLNIQPQHPKEHTQLAFLAYNVQPITCA